MDILRYIGRALTSTENVEKKSEDNSSEEVKVIRRRDHQLINSEAKRNNRISTLNVHIEADVQEEKAKVFLPSRNEESLQDKQET